MRPYFVKKDSDDMDISEVWRKRFCIEGMEDSSCPTIGDDDVIDDFTGKACYAGYVIYVGDEDSYEPYYYTDAEMEAFAKTW